MTTEAYRKFVELIEEPLKSIATDDECITEPCYLSGSIRHEANSLKRGTKGRKLPAVIATYDSDEITEQRTQPKTSRLKKDQVTVISERNVTIYGVVATIDEESVPGDYIKDIDELLSDVKRVMPFNNLKFKSVGFILDNDEQSLGLAGFLLKISYNYTENY